MLKATQDLLLHYFRIINPFSVNRQGNNIGRQYRTGIYYTDESDKETAQEMMQAISKKNDGRLEPLRYFLDAEEYHQDYLKKNPNGYYHIDLAQ
ncbi:peptide-methionine (S)-S-oxide reductase [Enterococcus faecium]|uniref:peptide-methionine (S)-S-oxide reductase n=1 Tax=Enterococcus faecium TaxID=1352 RepID=UPI000B6E681F|nr:peptide-methionine (S)-S-oxide reductase [Enterococcus faecium]